MLATVISAAQVQSPPFELTAVHYWSDAAFTRIAIEVSGDASYFPGRATNPERLFFDFPGVRPNFSGSRSFTAEVGDRLVHRIRVAENQPGVARLVIDLASAVEFTVSRLGYSHEFAIELRPANAPPPDRTLQSEEVHDERARRTPLPPSRRVLSMPDLPRETAPAPPATIPDPPPLASEIPIFSADPLSVMETPALSAAIPPPSPLFPQKPIDSSPVLPGRLKLEMPVESHPRNDRLVADQTRCVQDALRLISLSESLKLDLEENYTQFLSLASVKKTKEIEKLARRIRSRLSRFYPPRLDEE